MYSNFISLSIFVTDEEIPNVDDMTLVSVNKLLNREEYVKRAHMLNVEEGVDRNWCVSTSCHIPTKLVGVAYLPIERHEWNINVNFIT